MKDFSAFLGQDARTGLIILSPEDNYLKTCSASFPRGQSASFLISTLNSFQGVLKVSSCSSSCVEVGDKCKFLGDKFYRWSEGSRGLEVRGNQRQSWGQVPGRRSLCVGWGGRHETTGGIRGI